MSVNSVEYDARVNGARGRGTTKEGIRKAFQNGGITWRKINELTVETVGTTWKQHKKEPDTAQL